MEQLVRMDKVHGLVAGIAFGPVYSRRFGRSLGINPLPPDRKLCTFDCPYCECGPTSAAESRRIPLQPFPSVADVIEAATRAVEGLNAGGVRVDSLTLTGNGETTLYPFFGEMLRDLRQMRDRLLPAAQIVVLTNGTRLHLPAVRRGLEHADQCVVKVDAGRETTFQQINRPLEPVTLEQITEGAAQIPRVMVQTMLVRGRVDNTGDDEIDAWIERVRRIAPQRAQIYSLERPPAQTGLLAVPRDDLERIASLLASRTNIPADVY